ncbi:2-hydroxyacid dehydrogenase [Terrihabitans rhizophilus]|uniref:2-hydroxyacid dehydrogenase n=1 Tax=Terrihabitans rhizophilus TaxID=3092662 RepID=A0ABU4RTN2_9HYPH|nr:2-hydroxyacid dehydrogenase [Terrihabitans sp. PJ23]MDX6807444.1 2-hydroxyacid dehydrogenase [Terrihabitans sp. PJ23]
MTKPDLLMLNEMRPFAPKALEAAFNVHRIWELEDAEVVKIAPDIRALASFGGRVDAPMMERFPRLSIISISSVGYDGIDVTAASRMGITVTNTPDVLTEEVADLAIGLLLATVREIPQAEQHLRSGLWASSGPYRLTASLQGRSVGIVGLGRIGKAIAKRLEGFGVPIAYYGRNRQADVAYTYHAGLTELAEAVDVVIAVTPGGAGTRHLIGADAFRALGPNGIFVNVARGSVVDEAALIDALRDGTILGAGLDVFENEPNVPQALMDMKNTVLLPHVASASAATRDAMAQLAVDNLIAWAEGRGPLTPVPETPWPARVVSEG